MVPATFRVYEKRQNVNVEIGVKPLPAVSRFRAVVDVMIARLRQSIRFIN